MRDRNRIHKLPIDLANQIAAGEVVERPASVLKELLENSLDAGSTEIGIQIEQGGVGLIRVQDNGCGICKEDLELALSQHATSKILSFSDLEKVNSFGFRGEALASIASVSRLSLTSSGYRIERKGRLDSIELIPQPPMPGTLVEVSDLFYNTPARRKFLRSEKTESLNLEQVFKRISLSHPQVAFYYQNGEREKQLAICRSPEARLRRIATLCGSQFTKTARYIQAESNGLKLEGWLSSRPQTDLQYFYVNGRMVRDKLVNHAVRQVYQEQAGLQGFPAFVLFFELDPEQVDVNVHPTKHEVRFREARTIHAFLSYSVREAFARSIPAGLIDPPVENLEINPLIPHSTSSLSGYEGIDHSASILFDPHPHLTPRERPDAGASPFKPILLLENTLCLGEKLGKLIVIDLKTILQKQMKAHFVQGGVSRTLLMPLRLKLAEKIAKAKIDIAQLGFEWSLLSMDAILLRKVPAFFKTLPEGFELFFETLLDCHQLSKAIESLIEFALRHQNFTLEEVSDFLQGLPPEQIVCYEFTAEDLREKLLN